MQFDGQSWSDFFAAVLGPSERVFPVYLLAMVALCAVLHWRRRVSGSLLGWLFPKSIYLHASHIVDLKLFAMNRAVAWFGLLNFIALGAFVASAVTQNLSFGSGVAPFHPIVLTVMLLLVADFGTYCVHRLHHETSVLWPFHALHHSAEVMTPLTLYRKHPVYDVISRSLKGVLIGLLQGGLLAAFGQELSVVTIAGANLSYVLFNALGANLRHSHIWLSYGPVMERVFISPAQHQIHHSIAPRHHDKNYGEVLAIWDWMFGTLYIPDGEEEIEYGLADREGHRLPQRHSGFVSALTVPVVDSFAEASRLIGLSRKRPDAEKATAGEVVD